MPAQIISASRRTDLPAFFTPWFLRRLREGFVMVRNPRNPEHVMRVSLAPEETLAILFWSRDYGPLLPHLAEIDDRGFRPCFQFTLTGYGSPLERRGPPKSQALSQFEALASRYDRKRVSWRYDPIVVGSDRNCAWHVAQFRALAKQVAPYAAEAVISFLDLYASAKRGLDQVTAQTGEVFGAPAQDDRIALARELVGIGAELGVRVRACCEPDLVAAGAVEAARCIDPELVAAISQRASLELKPAPTRKGCGCVAARDIGAYHCCGHGCVYCYANDSVEKGLQGAANVDVRANHLGKGNLEEHIPAKRKRGTAQLCLTLNESKPGEVKSPKSG